MANIQHELTQIQHVSGELHKNTDVRIGIVVGRFNSFIVESLVDGAVDTLLRHGVAGENIIIVRVPGAWEIPLTVSRLAKSKLFHAIIALGAVIRGSTPHFDFVAGESAKGLGAISLEHDIPIINGILTTDSIEQAIERSGTKAGNKGSEASLVALEMVSVLNEVEATYEHLLMLDEARYYAQTPQFTNFSNLMTTNSTQPPTSSTNTTDISYDDDDMPF